MDGLDLTGVREVFDGFVLAGTAVLVTTDHGVAEGVLNQESGELEVPEGEELYAGVGAIVPFSAYTQQVVADFGVSDTPQDTDTTHRALLPLSSESDLPVGAKMVQTAVNPLTGDQALVGRVFEITEIPTTSAFSVLRTVYLKPAGDAVVGADAGSAGVDLS